MATLQLSINKLYLPNNLTTPITATFYYKLFYATSWTLIEATVPIQLDGTITASPPPQINIDPSQKYVLRAVNDLCGFDFQQNVLITPYCPVGYTLSEDGTYCYQQTIISATPPSSPQNSVAATDISYSTCGSYIYSPGYALNGTGTSAQITTANPFWVNGAGLCADNDTTHGPLNRSGLWTSVPSAGQIIGFSICLTVPIDATYYIGMGNDNFGSFNLDGVNIVTQNEAALNAQYANGGACFKVWHIYPLFISAGNHILEIIGNNVSSVAATGAEVYLNTPAQIIAATAYSGLDLIFSTKDFIGMPIQLGNLNIGYQCPPGYALEYCNSPIVCVKTIITPVLY